jgi:hypothetical protein
MIIFSVLKVSYEQQGLKLTPWSWALFERSLIVWTLDSFPAFFKLSLVFCDTFWDVIVSGRLIVDPPVHYARFLQMSLVIKPASGCPWYLLSFAYVTELT